MVGGGADISRAGAIKFGTMDNESSLLSSSPAAPSVVGAHLSDAVKTFGTLDANSSMDPAAVKAPRRSVNGPVNGGKPLDAHALFGAKPRTNGSSTPPQGLPPTHDRRQSLSGFQPTNGTSPNTHPAHLRPPQAGPLPGQQPRSPVLSTPNQGVYPNAPQMQQGFRPPQHMASPAGYARPNGPPTVVQPGMQRNMGMGTYGMHPGQSPYPVMGYPQGYYDSFMYNAPQYSVPQWAPQQHPPNQPYNMPVSPRVNPAQLAHSPSPAPISAALPSSGGASPIPTPPSRPPSLMSHQATPSSVSVSSIPSTPSRPSLPPSSSFTPPVGNQSLSVSASSFTPRATKAIKLTRPDGTVFDIKKEAAAAKGPTTPYSSGLATPETKEEAPKKVVPTMPVVVRMESESQRLERLKEEAQAAKIKEIEAKEEEERKERKARQAKEQAEKDAQAEKEREEQAQAKRAEEARAEEQRLAESKAAEDRAAESKAAEDAAKKAEDDRRVAEAAKKASEKSPAIAPVAAPADSQSLSAATPLPSAPASPLASPALGAAGLPPKPVLAAGSAALPRKPAPAALEITTPTPDSPATVSALSTARPIEDLRAIVYPGSLKSPQAELNADAEPGKYRYDRDFLMQFMTVCREKPDSLPPLEEIGLEAESSSGFGSRGGRGGRASMGTGKGNAPAGLGIGNLSSRPSFPQGMGSFRMGEFGSLRGSTSEDRYNRSLNQNRQGGMARTPSQGGVHGLPSMSLSTSRSGANRSRGGVKRAPQNSSQLDADVAPLAVSQSSWVRSRPTGDDEGTPAFIERKVKSLLNKLTAEKFDSISEQILEWANKSMNETDGMTLKLVIKQIFEKATDEAHWSSMYAKLCRMLLYRLDPAITEVVDGKPVSGGLLFRKYLVGRCQADFEAGWKAREDAATAAQAKREEDREKQEKNEEGGETTMLSDEYYAEQKAKRRGLGLVQLIGELYKLDMIGKGVIRSCFARLLANVETPDEEDLESTAKLLTTVGEQYDKASPENMEIVFDRLSTILEGDKVISRIRFMIMDVMDLRKKGWASKKAQGGVMTIAEVHQQAAREQAEKSAAAAQATRESISRGGSRAGARRDAQPGEWQSVGTAPVGRPISRPADFSQLGRGVSSVGSAGPNFGPKSVFNNKAKGKAPGSSTPPLSRQASTSNMNSFSALDEAPASERRESADANEPQRPKLKLKPRTKPIPGEEGEDADEAEDAEDVDEEEEAETPKAETAAMSEDDAKSKIDSDMKELWGEKDAGGARNPDDIVEYFRALPEEHQSLLSVRLVDDVFRMSKMKDAEIVAKGWTRALSEGVASKDDLLKGVTKHIPTLDEDALDFPSAYKAIAVLVRALSLSDEEIVTLVGQIQVEGSPRITPATKFERALAAVDEEQK